MKSQNGFTLIMVLVVIAVLMISTLALVQSSRITNASVGNMAFKVGASIVADVAIKSAMIDLAAVTDRETTVANDYYAVQQAQDAYGIPATVDWTQVATVNVQNYKLQQVTERLCNGPLPVTNVTTQCSVGPSQLNSSQRLGAVNLTSNAVYYRVTVRVAGPKNTLSYIQAILMQ